jgi:hypothetical protein
MYCIPCPIPFGFKNNPQCGKGFILDLLEKVKTYQQIPSETGSTGV